MPAMTLTEKILARAAGKTAVQPGELVETFADVARRLGGIAAERILWLPRPATEDDLLRLAHTQPDRPLELVDGLLVEKAMGFRESVLAALLITELTNFVRPRQLGVVAAPDAPVRVGPGQVRLPDVCFFSWERLRAAGADTRTVAPVAPDLAVEVLSPGNTPQEMDRKRHDYFAAGTQLVWEIDPDTRTVAVYTPADPTTPTRLTAADTLTGGEVLPGFALPLARLFGDPQLGAVPGAGV